MNCPLPLDPRVITAETAHLTPREHSALLRYALHYWSNGDLPKSLSGRAKIANQPAASVSVIEDRIMPFFEPGGLFPIMREAAAAKHLRRARAGRLGGLKRRSRH